MSWGALRVTSPVMFMTYKMLIAKHVLIGHGMEMEPSMGLELDRNRNYLVGNGSPSHMQSSIDGACNNLTM